MSFYDIKTKQRISRIVNTADLKEFIIGMILDEQSKIAKLGITCVSIMTKHELSEMTMPELTVHHRMLIDIHDIYETAILTGEL